MSKSKVKSERPEQNPFLTDKANLLWDKLDKQASPVSKEEIQRRIEDLKNRNGKDANRSE